MTHGELCRPVGEDDLIPEFCPDFCCGSCSSQYCCSDELKKVQWSEDVCTASEARYCALETAFGVLGKSVRIPPGVYAVHSGKVIFSTATEAFEQLGSALRFRSDFDSDPMSG
ncbi:hypothetical protein U0070_022261 [Myodes glareolus]|uniref:Shisa N-terminal domain-containing protein n=1 Tax=Myodes glareolus TaxID=447135 RepID=A0AAW0HD48_MYOGA